MLFLTILISKGAPLPKFFLRTIFYIEKIIS